MLQLRHFFFLSLSHTKCTQTHTWAVLVLIIETQLIFFRGRGGVRTHTHTPAHTLVKYSHTITKSIPSHNADFFFHLVLYRSHFLFALTLTIEAWQTTAFFFTHTPLKNSRTHCDTSTLLKTLSLKQLKFHTRLKHSSTHKWNTLTHTS